MAEKGYKSPFEMPYSFSRGSIASSLDHLSWPFRNLIQNNSRKLYALQIIRQLGNQFAKTMYRLKKEPPLFLKKSTVLKSEGTEPIPQKLLATLPSGLSN